MAATANLMVSRIGPKWSISNSNVDLTDPWQYRIDRSSHMKQKNENALIKQIKQLN